MNYRPEIDGLRAVAILPVVLYHAGVSWVPGGFVGVDVFFVISGYLITSIILGERAAGTFTLTGFYGRRIRRIFPALFLMMGVSYPIAWALLDPSAMAEFSGSIAASTVFFANVYFLEVSGYFETAAEFKPLLHNWSLSVEEQFYLIFPMAVLLTWRAGTRWQVCIFMAVALISLALAQWQIERGNAARAFFLLYSRLWELMVGVLVAYWLATPQGAALRDAGRLRHAALLGLALILGAVFTFDTETAFPGLAALLPCVGAALVIAFSKGQSLSGRLLGWRPVVFVGLVSYSLYLWHVPALVFTRIGTGRDDLWLMLAACALAFALACLSWRYVERPFRRMHALPPLRLFGTAAVCMAALGGLGLLGQETDGFRAHYLAHRLDPETRANYERFSPTATSSRVADDGCRFRDEVLAEDFGTRLRDCAARHGPGIFILGDSHAENVYNALRSTEQFPFLVGLTRGGCRPYQVKAKCSYDAVIPFLEAHRDAVAQVVFHVSGSHYILDHRNEGDSDAAFAAGTEARITEENITLTANYLTRLPAGLDILWLGPFAEARVDLANPGNYSFERLRFNPVALAHFDVLEARLKTEAERQSAYRYVSLLEALAFDQNALVQGDCLTFWDVDHFSPCGERLFGPTIADLVLSKAPLTQ